MTPRKQATTWTPANPALPGAATLQVQTPKRSLDDFAYQLSQNAAGAVGVAGLVALAGWWATGHDWQATVLAAMVAGAAVFCLALAVRAFSDEGALVARTVRKEMELSSRIEEIEAEWSERLESAEAALSDAIAEADHWQAVASGLRTDRDMAVAELQQYRARIETTYRSKASLYDKARRDAKELMRLTFDSGRWLARDVAMDKLEWQKGRWEDAFGLLKDCGCLMQHGAKGNHVRILINEIGAAFAAIDEHTGAVSLSEED